MHYTLDCIARIALRIMRRVHIHAFMPLYRILTHDHDDQGPVFALNSNSMQIILVVIQVQIFDRYDIYTS